MASVTPIRNLSGDLDGVFIGYVTTSFDGPRAVLRSTLAPNGAAQVQSVNVLIVCPTPGSQK